MVRRLIDKVEDMDSTFTETNVQHSRGPNRQRFQWGWTLFYAVLLALAILVIWFATFRPILVLPRIRLAPGFSFQDIQRSQSLRNEDLRGQLTLYTFTFDECLSDGTGCTFNTQKGIELRQQLDELQTDDLPIALVTVLLNEELAGELGQNNLPLMEGWHIVHGDALTTRYVTGKGFNLFYAEAGSQGRTENYVAPKVIMVDGLGTIRSEYGSGLPTIARLTRDIGFLQEEFANRDGVTRLGYEAAHLFVCYP